MLGDESRRQSMGAPDDDKGDQAIRDLFEEASKLYGTPETPTSGSSAPSNLMRMDEAKIIGRVPLR